MAGMVWKRLACSGVQSRSAPIALHSALSRVRTCHFCFFPPISQRLTDFGVIGCLCAGENVCKGGLNNIILVLGLDVKWKKKYFLQWISWINVSWNSQAQLKQWKRKRKHPRSHRLCDSWESSSTTPVFSRGVKELTSAPRWNAHMWVSVFPTAYVDICI